MRKIVCYLGSCVLHTTTLISFKFNMYGYVYIEHTICKFGKNQLSSFRDTRG